MAYQATFQRYESKYLLTRQQKHVILQEMQPHMQLDAYGRTTIRNIYYGTPILSCGQTLMEIKCAGGLPLWMCSALHRAQVYQTSFSKYGRAYQDLLQKEKTQEEYSNVC